MDDANQIEVPPSFQALYATAGGYRLSEPMTVVRQHYELCEDLAQMLIGQAQDLRFQLGVTDRDVLGRMQAGLVGPQSPVTAAQGRWVILRLAELLEWQAPDPPEPPEPCEKPEAT